MKFDICRFFFPINLEDKDGKGVHWVAGVVDIKSKKIFIFDSLSGNKYAELGALILQVMCDV